MTDQGSGPLINKVAESGLITIDMEDWVRNKSIITFDLKGFLFREAILREKEFREALKGTDWEAFRGKVVAVHCSADAIIPRWAWMLVATYLNNIADSIHFGTESEVRQSLIMSGIHDLDVNQFENGMVVIKGCGEEEISEAAYLEITNKLMPFVKSIMYGEPCSTVPIYKAKSKKDLPS